MDQLHMLYDTQEIEMMALRYIEQAQKSRERVWRHRTNKQQMLLKLEDSNG